jgi:hypothetical protein
VIGSSNLAGDETADPFFWDDGRPCFRKEEKSKQFIMIRTIVYAVFSSFEFLPGFRKIILA